jgi:hypothetical protein
MITKLGELIAYIKSAAQQYGANSHTDVMVRIGTLGPIYQINNLKGVRDQRGAYLLLELNPIPEAK